MQLGLSTKQFWFSVLSPPPREAAETFSESSSWQAGGPGSDLGRAKARESLPSSQELAGCTNSSALLRQWNFKPSLVGSCAGAHLGLASARTRHTEHQDGLTQSRSTHGCHGPCRSMLHAHMAVLCPAPGSRAAEAHSTGRQLSAVLQPGIICSARQRRAQAVFTYLILLSHEDPGCSWNFCSFL